MYLRKLGKKFQSILPKLDTNEMTPQEAKTELLEAWDASKSRVELIFRTETTTYFGKTQVAFFNGEPDIIGFLFDSIRDRSRTAWCKTRHGLVYRPNTKLLTENTPSCHWNCRSHLIPLADTPENRKMLEDPNRDPELKKVEPLPPGWRK
jgi:SPP1 gp7 family putative phage head morphogenesis protein